MLPGQKYTPQDILKIARKRRWLIAVPLVVGIAAGAAVFKFLPSKYQSETLIMVIPQRIPDTYVKPTVIGSVEDRLPTINDQILSRSRLERIINDFDLYRQQRATGLMEDVVQRMRGEIEVKLVGKESFRVAYISRDPTTAQRVTERLAGLYIEENLRDRENITQDTNQFLESQLQDAKRRLVEHEQKLEEYKRRYAGQLPTQLQSNVQAIQNAQMQMQAVSESLNRARERRLLIERQLADAQTPIVAPAPAAATPADGVISASPAEQLEIAKARLELLKLRYTPDHPDVRAQQRVIADLEAKVAEDKRRPATAPERVVSPAEAAAQKRVRDYQAEIEVIDRQIAANVAEETRLKNTIADYQSKVDAVPTRESELVELTRDYGTLQEAYTSLLQKQEESKLAYNLERRQIGEHFKILDPASFPEKPSNQKQKLLFLAGSSVGGLLLGLGLVGFLEYRDTSFKVETDITRVLALPVLAIVPLMESVEGADASPRRSVRAIVFSVVLTVIVLGSAAVFTFKWLH